MIKDTLKINEKILGINGNSKLVAYIGHDGLMVERDVIILAWYSK